MSTLCRVSFAGLVWLTLQPVALYSQQPAESLTPDPQALRDVEQQLGEWESSLKQLDLPREQIVALLSIVQRNEYPRSLGALLALTKTRGPLPTDAISVLLGVANDSRYDVRQNAITALVVVGAPAVEPLRKLLVSKSPRERAVAVAALGQLRQLDPAQALTLINDEDPRVRAELAHALASQGAAALPLLQKLLADSEVAVRVEAIDALGRLNVESQRIVPLLIPMLAQPDTAAAAFLALVEFGTEARSAIPAIIRAQRIQFDRTNRWDYVFDDSLLVRFGRADTADRVALQDCLRLPNLDARTLAARALGEMGADARDAADDLLTTAVKALQEASTFRDQEAIREARKLAGLPPLRNGPNADEEISIETANAALALAAECAAARWRVTRNSRELTDLVIRIVKESGESLTFSFDISPWPDMPKSATPDIVRMLRHRDQNVRDDAYNAVGWMGERALDLLPDLLLIEARDDLSKEERWLLYMSLGELGKKASAQVEPRLIAALAKGYLSRSTFAGLAPKLQLRTPAALEALRVGIINSANERVAVECATALCELSDDPRGDVERILAAQRSGKLPRGDVARMLTSVKGVDDLAVPFLVEGLDSGDVTIVWLCIDAIAARDTAGRPALPKLNELLKHEGIVPWQAAKAILLIASVRGPFDAKMVAVREQEKRVDRSDRDVDAELTYMFEALRGLGPEGRPYLPDVIRHLSGKRRDLKQEAITTLGFVGGDVAERELRSLATDRDAEVQSWAKTALDQLRNSVKIEPPAAQREQPGNDR